MVAGKCTGLRFQNKSIITEKLLVVTQARVTAYYRCDI